MMIIWIFAALVVMWIVDLIRWFVARKEAKRAAIRADFRHAETLEAWAKLEQTIKNSKPDVVEFNSLKRWMRATIEHLEQHGDKMEELFGAMHPEQEPIDFNKILEDEENAN